MGAVSCQLTFFYNEYLFTADEHPGWQITELLVIRMQPCMKELYPLIMYTKPKIFAPCVRFHQVDRFREFQNSRICRCRIVTETLVPSQVEIIPSVHAEKNHVSTSHARYKLLRSTWTFQLASAAFSDTSMQLEYELQQWFASRGIHTYIGRKGSSIS